MLAGDSQTNRSKKSGHSARSQYRRATRCRLSGWRGGVGLSSHDRSFRFHRILLSEELVQVGDLRSRPESHSTASDFIGSAFGVRGVDGMAADVLKRSDVIRGRAMMLSAPAPGIAVPQGGS